MNSEGLRYIADHYGCRSQMHKTIEECQELAFECQKIALGGKVGKALITEIADVEVMIAQIKYLLMLDDDEIEAEKDFKIDRQLKRIEREIEG